MRWGFWYFGSIEQSVLLEKIGLNSQSNSQPASGTENVMIFLRNELNTQQIIFANSARIWQRYRTPRLEEKKEDDRLALSQLHIVCCLPDFLALNHKSRILGHSSNPVCGFSIMEQVRLCAVWLMEGSSLNHIQGWTTVRESYSRALEQGPLVPGCQGQSRGQ